MREELIKARELSRKQQLTAPVDGIVQELAVHTTGGVVSPAEVLMKIVPLDQPLMAEVWLENKDIGFVEAGQPAEIKVHTFPFTKYGVIPGTIEKLSADATADELKGLIYKASVRLSRTALDIDGRMVELVPGMGVSAEVKTGKRLLIEYITAPLLRYKSDSVEER
ncbi:HlyD family efflux transporter periplasmic adaptor subunit [Marinobacterium aestuariivivens]|uniref:HlyD family efflux transporter periplasmic adaptor subunit n=1 Tax=Marinobacterium aestuariivivens TaxID=1698799 RepID=A0ABW1ZWT2_9GAMM